MEGATIGQYRVTGVIGQGGMGAVYAAEHALLGRPAAIKVLLPELSQKQEVVMRFFNEARAATAIRHPGIVEIYDFGWTPDGAAFIVMERLDGETLAGRLMRRRFRWQAALASARQIAGALGAAHAKGIVHRDLKPENVFVVSDPEVPGGERIKLLDFGIAKLAGDITTTVNVTKTGAVMGTPTYMAPEQCRGVAVDHRADLYALGCVVFELCCGRPPFVGEGSGDVLAAHIHTPPPTLAAMGVEAPPAVEELVRRLLAKQPAQRVQTAEELIRAIDALAIEPGRAANVIAISPRALTTSPSMTTLSGAASTQPLLGVARAASQRRSVALVAGVAAVITVVVVTLAMRRSLDVAAVPSSRSQAAEGPPAPPAGRVARVPVESTEPPTMAAGSGGETPAPAVPAPTAAAASSTGTAAETSASSYPAAQPAPIAPRARSAPAPAAEPVAPAVSARPRLLDVGVGVDVDSSPAGAQVMLGTKLLGKTPFHGTLPRRSGEVTLVIRLTGYLDKDLVVRADRPIKERVKLVRSPGSDPADRDKSVNPF